MYEQSFLHVGVVYIILHKHKIKMPRYVMNTKYVQKLNFLCGFVMET